MNTQKAAYWLALAIFGVALHSEYQRGAFPILHRAADCASLRVAHIAAHAKQAATVAKVLIGSPTPGTDRMWAKADSRSWGVGRRDDWRLAQNELRQQARDQAGLAREQVRAQLRMVRSQLELERVQRQQVRLCEHPQIRLDHANPRIIVLSPNNRVALTVDDQADLSDLDTEMSNFEAGDRF